MTYSIIDSIKGGSGKTCFSLHLTLAKAFAKASASLDKKEQNDPEAVAQKAEPALYLDMDIAGSSIESILWGEPFVGFGSLEGFDYSPIKYGVKIKPYKPNYTDPKGTTKIYQRASRYLNNIIDNEFNAAEYISHMEFPFGAKADALTSSFREDHVAKGDSTSPPTSLPLDIIISSSRYVDKERYRGSGSHSAVNASVFRYKIKHLLERVNSDYDDCVFDMPPGGGVYSDCIYDILLTKDEAPYKLKNAPSDGSINVYHMTTLDASHIDATVERVANMYGSHIHYDYSRIGNIIVVINDTIGNIETCKKHLKLVKKKLNERNVNGQLSAIQNKIKIIVMQFREDYRNIVMGVYASDDSMVVPSFNAQDPRTLFAIEQLARTLSESQEDIFDGTEEIEIEGRLV